MVEGLQRSAARHRETPIHAAADAHLKPMTLAVMYGLLSARKAYKAGGDPVAALRRAMQASMPPVLSKTLVAGGEAALGGLRTLGDVAGHEFHGNQWTDAGAVMALVDRKGAIDDINSRLRDSPDLLSDKGWEQVDALDKVMARSKTEEAMTVHRIMPDELEHLGVGDTFEDKGFVSTSKSRADLERVKRDVHHDGPSITLTIQVPKGSRAVDVNKVAGNKHRFSHQNEVLLDRRQTFRIDKVQRNDETDQHEYHVTLLAPRGASLRTLKPPTTKKIGPLTMRFDAKNERAAKWAKQHATELIDQMAETTREGIKVAVERAHEEGGVGDVEDEVLDAIGNEARANVIARTETMTAANEGQRQGWEQAVEKGLLPEDATVSWIVTDIGPCPECEALDGETRTLDGTYVGGVLPILHPNCRCTEGISGF